MTSHTYSIMAKWKIRHPGKVDYTNLGKVGKRWYTLEDHHGKRERVYGYKSDGRWFGYTRSTLANAPCSHCGRTGVFGRRLRSHWCATCAKPHDCKGEPSMSWHGCGIWQNDWREIW